MEDYRNLHGIALRSSDSRDSSRVVTFFSLEAGILTFLARGAKRNKSRTLNLTEPFVEAALNLSQGKGMLILKDGEIRDAHLGIRKSIHRLSAASFFCECAAEVLVPEVPEPMLYGLLRSALSALENAESARITSLSAAYLWKLSSFLGFRPTLGSCVVCGRKKESLDSGTVALDLEAGGITCEEHASALSTTLLLSAGEYFEIIRCLRTPLAELSETEAVDARKMNALAYRYFMRHTGIQEPRSYDMMHRMGHL